MATGPESGVEAVGTLVYCEERRFPAQSRTCPAECLHHGISFGTHLIVRLRVTLLLVDLPSVNLDLDLDLLDPVETLHATTSVLT